MDFSDVVDNDVREVFFYCNKMIKNKSKELFLNKRENILFLLKN